MALIPLLLGLLLSTPTQAAGVVGTGTPQSCTSQALANAVTSGDGQISFNCGAAPASILITQANGIAPTPGSRLTIDGNNRVTLSGGNNTRIFYLFFVAGFTLTNITLSDGFENTGDGGCISNSGVLVMQMVTLTHCVSTSGKGGALALFGAGAATLVNTRILSSTAAAGGGIYNLASLALFRTLLRDNNATSFDGGGIWASGPTLILSSNLVSNTANRSGGGIFSQGTLSVTHSVVSSNTAFRGAGIYNSGGTLSLTNSLLSGNFANDAAGAIYNGGTAWLSNSTLDGNRASHAGGGVYNSGPATLVNMTFSGNRAILGSGGGIANYQGAVTLTNVTLNGNLGGIYHYGTSVVESFILKDTIVANSPGGNNCLLDIRSTNTTIISNGYNLSSDDSCTPFFNKQTDWNKTNPLLGPLLNNGGGNLTHLPLASSAAVDHGFGCPPADERGVLRPQGPACDIGAVERLAGETTPWLYLPLIVR